MGADPHGQVRVFCSYAREDHAFLQEVKKIFGPLELRGVATAWDDHAILPSADWHETINRNLRDADLIVFLVSRDFLASKYILEVEVPVALERLAGGDCHVVPVIVRVIAKTRPGDAMHSLLTSRQCLPRDAVPVMHAQWASQDDAWADVADGLRDVIDNVLAERRERSERNGAAAARRAARAAARKPATAAPVAAAAAQRTDPGSRHTDAAPASPTARRTGRGTAAARIDDERARDIDSFLHVAEQPKVLWVTDDVAEGRSVAALEKRSVVVAASAEEAWAMLRRHVDVTSVILSRRGSDATAKLLQDILPTLYPRLRIARY